MGAESFPFLDTSLYGCPFPPRFPVLLVLPWVSFPRRFFITTLDVEAKTTKKQENTSHSFLSHHISGTLKVNVGLFGAQAPTQSKLCLRSGRWLQRVHAHLCCSMCYCKFTQLTDCGVALKMAFSRNHNVENSRSSQVFPERSDMQQHYTVEKMILLRERNARCQCDSKCLVSMWVVMLNSSS